MSKRKKRVYNSESRLAQAAQTKGRILASAKQLFLTEGFEPVTIEKIAKAANVSGPTIYSLFQSKRGLLRALMDEALPLDHILALVEEGKNQSAEKRLAIAAKISRQLYDAERAQMDIFRGASAIAPEFKELEQERERRRYQRQEETVTRLFHENSLIEGLKLSEARDILWAFTGRDMYRMFVVERGWSSDEYEKWLTQLLVKALIKPSC